VKTYNKILQRQFTSHLSRFFSILLIVFVSITFIAGITATSLNMTDSMNTTYEKEHTPDIQLINNEGLSDNQIYDIFTADKDISRTLKVSLYQQKISEKASVRFYIFDFVEFGLSPLSEGQILIDEHYARFKDNQTFLDLQMIYWNLARQIIGGNAFNMSDIELEQYITDNDLSSLLEPLGSKSNYQPVFNVSGTYYNPLYLLKNNLEEMKQENIVCIYYLDIASVNEIVKMLPINELYIYVHTNGNRYSNSYEKTILKIQDKLKILNNNYTVLSLFENETYMVFSKSAKSIGVLGVVFPVIFFLITLFVILSTMGKMVDKERLLIGTLKSLGFSNTRIRNKYILYVSLPSLIGGVSGALVGFRSFPLLIWGAYKGAFNLPDLLYGFYYFIAIAALAGLVVIILLTTLFSVNKILRERPYLMLRPVSPKPGKRIILEKIPWLWKRLKFKTKSMFKNMFRFVKNSLLTIVGLAGATSIMFLAVGLKRSIDLMFHKKNSWFEFNLLGSEGILYGIVLVLILFSVLLCVLVIYSLINALIDEREKEIATLKVLGYTKKEVIGYLYREEAVLASIGIVFGVGLGMLLLKLIVAMMNDNGTPLDFNLHPLVFVFSLALILIFTIISGLLMIKKINKISMANSLKAVE
jgi:putative ABC transport system permease protein